MFLDLSLPFLMSLPNEVSLSYSEKRRLVHAVRALKAVIIHPYPYRYMTLTIVLFLERRTAIISAAAVLQLPITYTTKRK